MNVTLPALYDAQYRAFFNAASISVCEASPKAGKTLGAIVWLTSRLLADRRPNMNWWWVAPIYSQAEIGYRRTKVMLREVLSGHNDTAMRLDFDDGKRMVFRSAEKPDSLYGEDVADCVIDEFTRVREESWWAIQTTMTATGGDVRLIGNVKGRGNWGYRLARQAESGDDGMEYHRITADDAIAAGLYTERDLMLRKSRMPEHIFRELYYCEPSDDGGNPFGIGHIARCVAPLSVAAPVAFGVDLAKSVDWTVVIGLDEDGTVCRFERWQHEPWERTVARLTTIIGAVPALVDSTGVGDPIVERLIHRGLPVQGYRFTSMKKQQLMQRLAVAIQCEEIRFPDGPIRSELEAFEYEERRDHTVYAAPAGQHDDCVCALALAVMHAGRGTGSLVTVAEYGSVDDEEPILDFKRLREDPGWGF